MTRQPARPQAVSSLAWKFRNGPSTAAGLTPGGTRSLTNGA